MSVEAIPTAPGPVSESGRVSEVRQFLTSQGLGQAADSVTALVLAGALLAPGEQGVNPEALLHTVLAAALPYATVGPLSGVIADRYSRRRLLGSVNVARAALTVVAAIAVAAGDQRLGLVTAAALISCARLVYTLRAASIPRLVAPGDLVEMDARALFVGMIAWTTGAALGAVGSTGAATTLLGLAAGAQLLSAVGFGTLRVDLGGRSDRQHHSWRETFTRVAALVASPPARRAILLTSSSRALLGATFASAVLAAANEFDFAERGYLVVVAVTGVGSFLGTLTAPTVAERSGMRMLAFGAFAMPAAALFTAVALHAPLIWAVAVASSFWAFQNLRVTTDAIVQATITDGARARVFSIYDAAYNLSYFGGAATALVFGLADRSRPTFAAIGVCFAVAAALVAVADTALPPAPEERSS